MTLVAVSHPKDDDNDDNNERHDDDDDDNSDDDNDVRIGLLSASRDRRHLTWSYLRTSQGM